VTEPRLSLNSCDGTAFRPRNGAAAAAWSLQREINAVILLRFNSQGMKTFGAKL
jgi:hypothetical protein